MYYPLAKGSNYPHEGEHPEEDAERAQEDAKDDKIELWPKWPVDFVAALVSASIRKVGLCGQSPDCTVDLSPSPCKSMD